jgi:hypothetical protein
MHCEGKLQLRSHNTSYCLIEVVTKAGLTVLPLMLWVWVLLGWGVLNTTFFNKVCHWHMTGRWLSLSTPVSSINKTDRHDKTEILLKVVINNINLWKIIPLQSNLVRDRPFNLKGGVWFFVSFRIFFSDNTIVRLFIFFVVQSIINYACPNFRTTWAMALMFTLQHAFELTFSSIPSKDHVSGLC